MCCVVSVSPWWPYSFGIQGNFEYIFIKHMLLAASWNASVALGLIETSAIFFLKKSMLSWETWNKGSSPHMKTECMTPRDYRPCPLSVCRQKQVFLSHIKNLNFLQGPIYSDHLLKIVICYFILNSKNSSSDIINLTFWPFWEGNYSFKITYSSSAKW